MAGKYYTCKNIVVLIIMLVETNQTNHVSLFLCIWRAGLGPLQTNNTRPAGTTKWLIRFGLCNYCTDVEFTGLFSTIAYSRCAALQCTGNVGYKANGQFKSLNDVPIYYYWGRRLAGTKWNRSENLQTVASPWAHCPINCYLIKGYQQRMRL